MDKEKKHYNIRITGWVQGVSFRFYAREKARQLGITGFVRNEPGGSVYIEAEGEESVLKQFEEWCRQGPTSATVSNVDVTQGNTRSFKTFDVQ